MSVERAPMFSGDDELDVSGFEPKAGKEKSAINSEQVRAVSAKADFRSREPVSVYELNVPPARQEVRRYRTGRNVQLNLKVKQETIDLFYALADRKGWVLGEAFEHAVQALSRELSSD